MHLSLPALLTALALTLALSSLARAQNRPPVKPPAPPPAQKEDPIPEGVKVQRDIEYAKAGDLSLKLDIYTPATAPEKPEPLVVWIYGGAWQGGSKTNCLISKLATQGYVVASIEYRHTDVAIFPAQIFDCKAAIRFLRANAAKYHADPDRIAAWGISSGGHLSALLGTTPDNKELEGKLGDHLATSSKIQAVVDFCGPVDFPLFLKGLTPTAKGPIQKLLGGLEGEKVNKLAIAASATHWVNKNAAQFFICHGDKDPTIPIAQSEGLEKALKDAGADVTFHVLQGGNHFSMQPETNKIATEWLDQHLKNPPAAAPR